MKINPDISLETKQSNEIHTVDVSKCEDLLNNNEEISRNNRSFFNRFFGKLQEGSLRSSILSLIILCVGLGCLSLPQRYSQIGIVIYSLLIITTAIITTWSLKIVIEAGRKANLTEYSNVILHYCGKKWERTADIIIIIFIYGVLIVYQIVIYQLLGALVFELKPGFNKEYKNDITNFYENSIWGNFWFKLIVMFSISVVIIFPLNIQKNISKLRYASFLGIFSLIVIILVLIIQLPDYISYNSSKSETNINIVDFSNFFKPPNFFFFKAIGTIFYSFSSHYGIFPIYKLLKNNSERRINKVINRSVIIICILFITIGIIGYFTDPVNTHDLIIKRNYIFDGIDYIMSICRLLVIIVLAAKIPNIYSSMRTSLLNILLRKDDRPEINLKINLCLTIPVTFTSTIIGIFYDRVDSIISFLGGFCATFISFIIPAIIYFKSNNIPIISMKGISVIGLYSIMSILGLASATLSFIDFIKKE